MKPLLLFYTQMQSAKAGKFQPIKKQEDCPSGNIFHRGVLW